MTDGDPDPQATDGWARNPGGRRSSRSTTGYFHSVRLEGGVHTFESRLELNLIEILDVDSSVRFKTQPETFRWTDGARRRRWTPDVLITPRDTRLPIYVEVKPAEIFEADPTLGGRIDGMVEVCAARGARFAVLTEKEIRSDDALRAARLIRSRALRCDEEVIGRVLAVITPLRLPAPLGMIEDSLATAADRGAVLGLIGLGILSADLSFGLSRATVVWRGPAPWL